MSSNISIDLFAPITEVSTSTIESEPTSFISILSMNPPVAAVEPQFLFSIDDLLNSQEIIVKKEDEDRQNLQGFISPSYEQLKPFLLNWAKMGFPSVYPIQTLKLNAPSPNSDGQTRNFPVYMEYLLGCSMESWLQELTAKSNGIYFTFSHNGGNTITLNVSRG